MKVASPKCVTIGDKHWIETVIGVSDTVGKPSNEFVSIYRSNLDDIAMSNALYFPVLSPMSNVQGVYLTILPHKMVLGPSLWLF